MKHESEFDETLEMILLNPNLGNNELLGKLVNDGMNENIATEILLFFPTALGRVFLSNQKINFPDEYLLYNGEILVERKNLSNNPIFVELMEYSKKVLKYKLSKNDLINLLVRGAEFNAINKALNNGSDLSNLKILPSKIHI